MITNCAATKKTAAGEPVHLRNWSGSVRQRFRWWRHAIEGQRNATPARDCYAGDAWLQILAAERLYRNESQLWVVSAGLGLIPADLPIPNYSATFVNSDPDSVASDSPGRGAWWNLLIEWRRETSGIGSITDLAEANPKSVFLIALSSPYLTVLKSDIVDAKSALVSPDNLLVISAGVRAMPGLGSSLLPIDARFENLVGGARSTLNARMLRYIVVKNNTRKLSAASVSSALTVTATKLDSPRSFERVPLKDNEITTFIRTQSRDVSRPSASSLLRILRDGGYACEQKRFHRLYKTIHLTQI
ncbi:MAG: hypothetical protein WCK77_08305 [Verrucomicrobiota bacterium]